MVGRCGDAALILWPRGTYSKAKFPIEGHLGCFQCKAARELVFRMSHTRFYGTAVHVLHQHCTSWVMFWRYIPNVIKSSYIILHSHKLSFAPLLLLDDHKGPLTTLPFGCKVMLFPGNQFLPSQQKWLSSESVWIFKAICYEHSEALWKLVTYLKLGIAQILLGERLGCSVISYMEVMGSIILITNSELRE